MGSWCAVVAGSLMISSVDLKGTVVVATLLERMI
jgi:hypothetical protein